MLSKAYGLSFLKIPARASRHHAIAAILRALLSRRRNGTAVFVLEAYISDRETMRILLRPISPGAEYHMEVARQFAVFIYVLIDDIALLRECEKLRMRQLLCDANHHSEEGFVWNIA